MYTCVLENTLISDMLKAEAVQKFKLSGTSFEKNSRKLDGKRASLIAFISIGCVQSYHSSHNGIGRNVIIYFQLNSSVYSFLI